MSTDQEKLSNQSKAKGAWKRNPTKFHNRISTDAAAQFPAESGRYRLYVCYLCPWAHRTLLLYKLKGLENCVKLTIATSQMYALKSIDENKVDEEDLKNYNGWYFSETKDENDPGFEPHGFKGTGDLYELSHPGYRKEFMEMGKRPVFNVPILFDEKTQKIVCNESSEIIIMLNTAFNQWAKNPALDLNPKALHLEISRVDSVVYPGINDGVYRCGFAQSQEAYNDAYEAHWKAMDEIEALLGTRKYLCGEKLTLSDIRLFVTLIRYDLVYFSLFNTSRDRIKDLPNLCRYLKEIYNYPGIKETVKPEPIVKGYYKIRGIYPLGPLDKRALAHLEIGSKGIGSL